MSCHGYIVELFDNRYFGVNGRRLNLSVCTYRHSVDIGQHWLLVVYSGYVVAYIKCKTGAVLRNDLYKLELQTTIERTAYTCKYNKHFLHLWQN